MKEKPIRFYTRRCRRCNSFYKTSKKTSKICSECRIPTVSDNHTKAIQRGQEQFRQTFGFEG